jgi:small subunit ribosomal protein S21
MKVIVKDGNINLALKKFKKKVEESGRLVEVLDRQYYEKPTSERKRRAAAAKARWKRKQKELMSPRASY